MNKPARPVKKQKASDTMKHCKQCGAELDDEVQICPQCGADNAADAPETVTEPAPATEPNSAPEAAPAAADEAKPADAPKNKKSMGALFALCLVAVAAVAVVLGKSAWDRSRVETPPDTTGEVSDPADTPTDSEDTTSAGGALTDATLAVTDAEAEANPLLHTNAYGYRSYSANYVTGEDGAQTYTYNNADGEAVTLSQEQVDLAMEKVVATAGSLELTNRDLLYYYDQQYYSFYSAYGSYLMYFMDTTKALDEQLDMNGTATWQQFFLDASLQAFQQVAALYDEAMANGYELDESVQASVDTLEENLNSIAVQNGYADAEHYLDDFFGAPASLETYREYLRVNQIASGYANSLADSLTFTDQELSDYYDANAETIQSNYGIEKIDKNMVNVRHILIQPEDTESDESWAEAEAEAQRIYDEWKAGEATEESFADLATEYSQDPGSQTTGGLYEDVYPGQMVTEFNDWCFADGRAVGDSGIVKTSYGYHIMFFSGEGEGVYWKTAVDTLMRNEKVTEMLAEITARYPLTTDASQIAILDRTAPTVPTAETETDTTTDTETDTSTETETDTSTETETDTTADTNS